MNEKRYQPKENIEAQGFLVTRMFEFLSFFGDKRQGKWENYFG
jgi:hypothetical protein